jgi:hypothetical protein
MLFQPAVGRTGLEWPELAWHCQITDIAIPDVAVLPVLLQPLNVYRNGKWGKLPGDALVPGDVVSVVRSGGFTISGLTSSVVMGRRVQ